MPKKNKNTMEFSNPLIENLYCRYLNDTATLRGSVESEDDERQLDESLRDFLGTKMVTEGMAGSIFELKDNVLQPIEWTGVADLKEKLRNSEMLVLKDADGFPYCMTSTRVNDTEYYHIKNLDEAMRLDASRENWFKERNAEDLIPKEPDWLDRICDFFAYYFMGGRRNQTCEIWDAYKGVRELIAGTSAPEISSAQMEAQNARRQAEEELQQKREQNIHKIQDAQIQIEEDKNELDDVLGELAKKQQERFEKQQIFNKEYKEIQQLESQERGKIVTDETKEQLVKEEQMKQELLGQMMGNLNEADRKALENVLKMEEKQEDPDKKKRKEDADLLKKQQEKETERQRKLQEEETERLRLVQLQELEKLKKQQEEEEASLKKLQEEETERRRQQDEENRRKLEEENRKREEEARRRQQEEELRKQEEENRRRIEQEAERSRREALEEQRKMLEKQNLEELADKLKEQEGSSKVLDQLMKDREKGLKEQEKQERKEFEEKEDLERKEREAKEKELKEHQKAEEKLRDERLKELLKNKENTLSAEEVAVLKGALGEKKEQEKQRDKLMKEGKNLIPENKTQEYVAQVQAQVIAEQRRLDEQKLQQQELERQQQELERQREMHRREQEELLRKQRDEQRQREDARRTQEEERRLQEQMKAQQERLDLQQNVQKPTIVEPAPEVEASPEEKALQARAMQLEESVKDQQKKIDELANKEKILQQTEARRQEKEMMFQHSQQLQGEKEAKKLEVEEKNINQKLADDQEVERISKLDKEGLLKEMQYFPVATQKMYLNIKDPFMRAKIINAQKIFFNENTIKVIEKREAEQKDAEIKRQKEEKEREQRKQERARAREAQRGKEPLSSREVIELRKEQARKMREEREAGERTKAAQLYESRRRPEPRSEKNAESQPAVRMKFLGKLDMEAYRKRRDQEIKEFEESHRTVYPKSKAEWIEKRKSQEEQKKEKELKLQQEEDRKKQVEQYELQKENEQQIKLMMQEKARDEYMRRFVERVEHQEEMLQRMPDTITNDSLNKTLAKREQWIQKNLNEVVPWKHSNIPVSRENREQLEPALAIAVACHLYWQSREIDTGRLLGMMKAPNEFITDLGENFWKQMKLLRSPDTVRLSCIGNGGGNILREMEFVLTDLDPNSNEAHLVGQSLEFLSSKTGTFMVREMGVENYQLPEQQSTYFKAEPETTFLLEMQNDIRQGPERAREVCRISLKDGEAGKKAITNIADSLLAHRYMDEMDSCSNGIARKSMLSKTMDTYKTTKRNLKHALTDRVVELTADKKNLIRMVSKDAWDKFADTLSDTFEKNSPDAVNLQRQGMKLPSRSEAIRKMNKGEQPKVGM